MELFLDMQNLDRYFVWTQPEAKKNQKRKILEFISSPLTMNFVNNISFIVSFFLSILNVNLMNQNMDMRLQNNGDLNSNL